MSKKSTDVMQNTRDLATFVLVVFANRGGVGKTSSAALVWALLTELGREDIRLGEIEGEKERKLSELLNFAEAPPADPCISVPSPTALGDNPDLAARTFAPALAAITRPSRPTIIDLGAAITRSFLEAARYAEHGDQTDGGKGLCFLVVAKAQDIQSATSAEDTIRETRELYPNSTIVLVITHVRYNNSKKPSEGHNAEAVVAAVQKSASGTADHVVLIPLLLSPFMGVLYGEEHITFHELARLDVANLERLLGIEEQEIRIHRGRFLEWYNRVLRDLSVALSLPPPSGSSAPGVRDGAHPLVSQAQADGTPA